MPSRRKIRTEKKVPNSSALGMNTRRLSIQIKRLMETGTANNIKSSDASLLEVEKWQQEICDHLKKSNHLDVLEDSDRVFNMKEAYFLLDPACTPSSFLTTLIVIGASGIMAPTTIFFPNNEMPPRNIFADETNAASISELPKDYPANDKLLGYMELTFHPWLISKQKCFPVIVFIDINPVHISWEFLSFCKENQIILLRTTSALSLHPISSFVLPNLENAWITALLEWNNKHENQQFALESADSILRQVFEKTITIDLLIDAFGKCGTFPFDPVTGYNNGITRHMASSTSLQTFDSAVPSVQQPAAMDFSHPTSDISQQEVIKEALSVNEESAIQQKIVDAPKQIVHPEPQHTQTSHPEPQHTQIVHPEPQHTQTVHPKSQSTQTVDPVPEAAQTVHPKPQRTQKIRTIQPSAQFQLLLGPLTYEFLNVEDSWSGAAENTSLFQVWQILHKSHQRSIHPIPQTAHPKAQEMINQEFRMQFEGLIGPLLHEFKKSGNIWTGATENRGLFEVWKQLIIKLEDSVVFTTAPN